MAVPTPPSSFSRSTRLSPAPEAALSSIGRVTGWLLLATVAGCGAAAPQPDADLRILFIGNSLTFAKDLPSMVQRLGGSEPGRTVTVASVAFPDFSLEDHWSQGDALAAIHGGWDFVGEALRSARAADADLALVGGDGFHPTAAGTFGAALVIYAMTAVVSPHGLSARAGDAPGAPDDAATLEQAAAEAIVRFGAR